MGGGTEEASLVRGSEDAAVRDLGDLVVATARYAPWVRTKPGRHRRPQLVLAVAGGVRVHFPDRSIEARAGDVLTYPAKVDHTYEFGPRGAELLTLAVEAEAPTQDAMFSTFTVRTMVGSLPLARRIRRELTRGDVHADLALRSLALQLLVLTARREITPGGGNGARPQWVGEAKSLLEAGFRDQVRVGAVAAQIGVTPMQLIRAFQRHFGTSPGAYLRQVRLQQALDLLEGTDQALASVALDAGYSDQSHLCRVIKEATGMTPTGYRKACREE